MSYEEIMSPDNVLLVVILPSIGSAAMVAEAISWLNLLPKPAFYLDILLQSSKDIVEFMYIYIIVLTMFAVGIAVISSNS
jgi:hypothetical protein